MFLRGRAPAVSWSWGLREYRLGAGGLESRRRAGDGWSAHPRSNYSETVARRQARDGARQEREPSEDLDVGTPGSVEQVASPAAAGTVGPGTATSTLEASLRAEVGERIGATADTDSAVRDPAELKARIATIRGSLAALDDVGDYAIVEAIDEELYQLHKSVEYKMRAHKASEAKARLQTLFKSGGP
jgi:hypothetical protein